MKEKDYGYTAYNSDLKEASRMLRKNMTPQERKLWYDFLRGYPVQWYRQRAIDRFVVDFYCAKPRLAVELDGAHHYTEQGLEYDAQRSIILEQHGVQVLRFENYEVSQNFEKICKAIDRAVKARMAEAEK